MDEPQPRDDRIPRYLAAVAFQSKGVRVIVLRIGSPGDEIAGLPRHTR